MKTSALIMSLIQILPFVIWLSGCKRADPGPSKPAGSTTAPPAASAIPQSAPEKPPREKKVVEEPDLFSTRPPGAPESPASRDVARRRAMEEMRRVRAKQTEAPPR